MIIRMKPDARKELILEAAIRATGKMGFANVRTKDIADEASCGYGTVSFHFNTMAQMRRAIMRAAIQRKLLPIIAQGLGIGDPDARKAPDDLKKKATALLLK